MSPSIRPKVADENARRETPLSSRSARTTINPSATPKKRPGHVWSSIVDVTVAPIAAQKVTKRTLNRLTVIRGVMGVLAWTVLLSRRVWLRYPYRKAHRVLAGWQL